MGIHAVSPRWGLTNVNLAETETDRAVISAGTQVIVVADATKLGRVSASLVGPIERVHILITDKSAPPELVSEIRQRGTEVILA